MILREQFMVFCTVILIISSTLISLSLSTGFVAASANQPSLMNSAVDPKSGDDNTTFTFSTYYLDYDGDKPVNVYVVINQGWYSMSTNDTDPTRGMYYSYSTNFYSGNISYFFFADNAVNETARDPLSGAYNLYIDKSNSSEPQLYDHQYSPIRPTVNNTINFTITYKDLRNDKPEYVKLYIRPEKSNNSYEIYEMTIIGNSYSSGVTCFKELTLKEGAYDYHFYALTKNGTIRDVQTNEYFIYVGPDNNINYPYLTGGTVSPMQGTHNKTSFTYTVIYSDGNASSTKYSFLMINNKMYTMKQSKIDPATNGLYYTYTTTLVEGNYTYYFVFSDGNVNVSLPSSGNFYGPYVSRDTPPNDLKVKIAVNPLNGPVNTTFYFNSTVEGPDINNLTYSWIFKDGYNVSGKKNIVRKIAKAGNYSVTLTVSDGRGLQASATASIYVTSSNVPPRNNPPVINTNLKSYNTVAKGTTLFISARGSYDPDGDPITYKWTIMSPMSNQSAMYTTPDFNYSFYIEGNITIYLDISDSKLITSGKYIVHSTSKVQKIKPTAKATVTVKQMTAMLSGKNSYDTDGNITSYVWTVESKNYKGMEYNHTYRTTGYKTVTLTITDNDGLIDKAVIGFYIRNQSNDPGRDDKNYNLTSIGSHVQIDDGIDNTPTLTIIDAEPGFMVRVVDSWLNYIKFEVESESQTGKLIVLDIVDIFEPESFNNVDVSMDGVEVQWVETDEILFTKGDKPMYNIVKEGDNLQLLLYIDHFSVHTIEVKADQGTIGSGPDARASAVNSWLIAGILMTIVIVIIIVAFLQIKKKRKVEYYQDFRVAEENTQNGHRTQPDEDSHVDWDDFI